VATGLPSHKPGKQDEKAAKPPEETEKKTLRTKLPPTYVIKERQDQQSLCMGYNSKSLKQDKELNKEAATYNNKGHISSKNLSY